MPASITGSEPAVDTGREGNAQIQALPLARSREKHPESVPALLQSLYDLRESHPRAVRNNVYTYPAEIYRDNGEGSSTGQLRDRRLTSWRMTEHMYMKADNVFPTLARGLFTEEIEEGDDIPQSLAGAEGREVEVSDHAEGIDPGREVDNAQTMTSSPRKKTRVVKERIAARGYDKFFNIGEVAWTDWDAMKKYSEGPYHLTLKSNGCLILISALTPTHLLVASKHSLGTPTERDLAAAKAAVRAQDDRKSAEKGKGKAPDENEDPAEAAGEAEDKTHAAVGRTWVKRTLKAKGKTEAELARRLWDQNLSAVLELCDDSFEEHVIATPEHLTGLHLHGLNHNTPHFSTLAPDEVTAFACEFGFIPTKVVMLDSLAEVRTYTDEVATTGAWEGDMIEGFVVRSTVRVPERVHADADATSAESSRPPYRPGAPFFFKVKFDEPYLLYRQWREVTRYMLPLLKGPIQADKEDEFWRGVKTRCKRPEVTVYADWVAQMMGSEPGLFEDFGRRVVRVRNRFLEWTQGDGKEAWAQGQEGTYKLRRITEAIEAKKENGQRGKNQKKQAERDIATLPKKWIIVPCAVPGVGKTLVGLVLARLFGFGHTQSDDVTARRSAPTFLANITKLLKSKDVVYADRNNHIDKHYTELAALHNAREVQAYNVRLVAVLWDIDSQPYHRSLRICSARVIDRGDNHQTLRPDLLESQHEAVVSKFIRDFTVPDEAMFDSIIDVSIQDTPIEAIRKIASGLSESLGLPAVDDVQIQAALEAARAYKTTTPYHPPDKVIRSVRYFGLAPEIDLAGIVEVGIYYFPPDLAQSAQRFLFALQAGQRVITSPHVTLVHETAVAAEKESSGEGGLVQKAWEECVRLVRQSAHVMWDFKMTHLVWNDRVMAILVEDLLPQQREGMDSLAQLVLEEEKEGMHITVGSKHEDIRPYEAKPLVEEARKRVRAGQLDGEAESAAESGGKIRWARLGPTDGQGRVKGMW